MSTGPPIGLPPPARRPVSGSPQPPPRPRPPQRSRRRHRRSSPGGRCGPGPRFASIPSRVPSRRRPTVRRLDPRRIPDDRPRRYQRLRPNRPPVPQGDARACPGCRGRRRQRPRRRPDQRPVVQARLDVRRLQGRRQPHRRLAGHRRQDGQGAPGQGPRPAAVGRPRGRHRDRVDGPVHRRRQGARPHRCRREEGHHQRPGEGRGHHDRARGQRGQVRPRPAPDHQQRQLHHELPRTGGQGGPRPVHHPARPDEHDPLVHERPADPRRRPQGPPPGARRRARTSSRPRPARPRPSRS